MKIKILFLALLIGNACLGQNVKIEIIDYYKKEETKEYSIYQFANASYSSSRASVFFVIPKNQFVSLIKKIPPLFTKKQEYTDVWVLGIDIDNKNKLLEVEEKITNSFFGKIIKYRSDNNLPSYDLNRLKEDVVFLDNVQGICKYLICSRTL